MNTSLNIIENIMSKRISVDLGELNKINVLVGKEIDAIRFTKEEYSETNKAYIVCHNDDVERNLHFSKYKEFLEHIINNEYDKPVILSTQSKEILEVLAEIVKDKDSVVNVFNIYKNDAGELKCFCVNQKSFIANIETNSELRD